MIRRPPRSTPSICFNKSTYFVLRFTAADVAWIEPGRVKIISARTFDKRRCKSSDIPCARPVNSITNATPSATPRTLIADLSGRWRILEITKLSTKSGPLSQVGNINTRRGESLAAEFDARSPNFVGRNVSYSLSLWEGNYIVDSPSPRRSLSEKAFLCAKLCDALCLCGEIP